MPEPTPKARRAQQQLARQLAQVGFALPGTLTERHMRCGKPSCRCKADPPTLHGPYLQWTRKVDGKTVTRLLSPDQRDRYRDWFDNDRKLKNLITELETLSLDAVAQAEGWDHQRGDETSPTPSSSGRTTKQPLDQSGNA